MKFHHIISMIAAIRLYKVGVPVSQIAAQAKRSKSTIYRWLKTYP